MNPKVRERIGVRYGQYGSINSDEVDYEVEHPTQVFGSHINMIPLTAHVHAPRHFYGARFYNQALPMDDPEEPLVQNLDPESGRSFDDIAGEFSGAERARGNGSVQNVDNTGVDVAYEDGTTHRVDLYDTFPFNRKTHRHDATALKAGDAVKAGDVLRYNNFTTPTGKLALGRNARVAVVPMKGWSMDDAIAISQEFANSLKSNRTIQHLQEFDNQTKGGLGHFTSLFPTIYGKEQLANIDEDGVVKKGSILNPGDPIVLATSPRSVSSADAKVGKLSRMLQTTRKNSTQTWKYDDPAKVLDVIKTPKGTKVLLNFSSPARVGDKGAFRTGAKFIVSKIIPDDKMPRAEDGKPVQMLLNQLSIYSRINSSLIHELLLGKVAKKEGKPRVVAGFTTSGVSQNDTIKALLDEHGLKSEEMLYDPEEHRTLENPVLVGNAYVMRLHHTADDKVSGRGVGSYDINQQPSKGSGEQAQSKRLSGLENLSLLSSGAYATLHEASTLRGQKSDDFWRAHRAGHPTPKPGKPFVWNKFHALLNGAGMKAREVNGKLRLGVMTDASVDALNALEVRNGELVDSASLEAIPGGLFDEAMVTGNRWGKINMNRPIPHPAMESSISAMLGLSQKEYREVIEGRRHINIPE